MPLSPAEIDTAALDWIIRTGDAEFADWEAFTAWLEADPAHGEHYHRLSAEAEAMTAAVAQQARPAEVAQQAGAAHRPQRRRWIGGAIAAALVGVVGFKALELRPQPYAVETAPGQMRVVALADGSTVALNGGTRVMLDRRDARFATVERGEALFTIRHDAAHPFEVAVADDRLRDIGTRFDVVRSGGETRVAVAEGAVLYNPAREEVRLDPGQALRVADGGGQYRRGAVDPAMVGGWQAGRLDYDGQELEEVAADLGRATGARLTVAPGIAARPFRGTILLDGLARDPGRIGALLNVRMEQVGDHWELTARP